MSNTRERVKYETVRDERGIAIGVRFWFGQYNGLELYRDEITDENVAAETFVNGMKQKVADSYASATTMEERREIARATIRRLCGDGQPAAWNATERGERSSPGGLLFQALKILKPHLTDDDVKEYLAGKDDKAQATLRKVPALAAIIADLKAKREKAPADLDDLADELDSL